MKIHIPLEICDKLRIDRWSYVSDKDTESLRMLLSEANKQLEIIASSIVAPITRSRYIQAFKERCLELI